MSPLSFFVILPIELLQYVPEKYFRVVVVIPGAVGGVNIVDRALTII